ncbi:MULTISPECIES: hypothetical protein [Rhodopseudomonas]|nr:MULTISPECIES: hypothetical protein [Rhodopseudomonas]
MQSVDPDFISNAMAPAVDVDGRTKSRTPFVSTTIFGGTGYSIARWRMEGRSITPEQQGGVMANRDEGRTVETPIEVRQGERGPSVLALLTISTGLAVLVLGVIWFVWFRL